MPKGSWPDSPSAQPGRALSIPASSQGPVPVVWLWQLIPGGGDTGFPVTTEGEAGVQFKCLSKLCSHCVWELLFNSLHIPPEPANRLTSLSLSLSFSVSLSLSQIHRLMCTSSKQPSISPGASQGLCFCVLFDPRIYCLASPGWILAEGAASLHELTSSVGTRSPFNSFLLIHIFPSNRSRKMFLSKCLHISPRKRLWLVLGALCPLVTSIREIWYWGREQGGGVIWAGKAVDNHDLFQNLH